MRPTLVNLSSGYTLLKSYTSENGAVVCEFTRSVTVPSGSENLMHDLTNPVYILYAFEGYSNGKINYHAGNTHITNTTIDLSPEVCILIQF